MNTLEITKYVQVQRACFDAFGAPLPQASQMVFRSTQFGLPQCGFFRQQLPRYFDIPGHEHPERELQIVECPLMEGHELGRALF